MHCNGLCSICGYGCYVGDIKNKENRVLNTKNVEKLQKLDLKTQYSEVEISPSTSIELQNEMKLNEVAVVESVGTYEVTKNIFGKEKVRKVK